ncbi:CopG family transcriptional regulator [Streptomyces sannanensis]|uniref:CopG family transcriptional regulator n=1 Tax=Streptomyces sannanensis TaxID=285536 RepID=A0ABP6S8K9_9ACTN
MTTQAYAPGEGPTKSVSVSVHQGTIEAVRARVGRRGISGYVEAAIQRQIERDNLAELIAANEELHGPLTDEEIRDAEEKMFGPTDKGAGSRAEAAA